MSCEIIGHGDIASVLTPREGFCFFACGVSNSQEDDERHYEREKNLLLCQDRTLKLVYFSSLRVNDEHDQSRYTRHKREMEELIIINFPNYCILRLGNITWGENPHTFINYFKCRLAQGKIIDVWDVERYIIEKEELLQAINKIPEENAVQNIHGTKMLVIDVVKKYIDPNYAG